MKQFISIMMLVMAALTGCGVSNGKTMGTEAALHEKGLEVISLMDEMISNDTYMEFHTASGEIREIIDEIAAGDYSEPIRIYEIAFSQDDILSLFGETGLELGSASEKLQRNVEQRILASVISQINAMGGAVNLAASTVCTAGTTFVNQETIEDVIYLYVYKDTYPAAVTFTVGEDGAVSASGSFVLYEDFKTDSEQEIVDYFEDMGAEVTALEFE